MININLNYYLYVRVIKGEATALAPALAMLEPAKDDFNIAGISAILPSLSIAILRSPASIFKPSNSLVKYCVNISTVISAPLKI